MVIYIWYVVCGMLFDGGFDIIMKHELIEVIHGMGLVIKLLIEAFKMSIKQEFLELIFGMWHVTYWLMEATNIFVCDSYL